MPLTYDDREDLYIEIERLRHVVARLENERDSLKQQLHNMLILQGVIHG